MISVEQIFKQAYDAKPEEAVLGNTLAKVAEALATALGDRKYMEMSVAQREFQARVASVVAASTTKEGAYQLHQLIHLLHGYGRKMWPDPRVEAMRALRNETDPKEQTKPDVVIKESLHAPEGRGEDSDRPGGDGQGTP